MNSILNRVVVILFLLFFGIVGNIFSQKGENMLPACGKDIYPKNNKWTFEELNCNTPNSCQPTDIVSTACSCLDPQNVNRSCNYYLSHGTPTVINPFDEGSANKVLLLSGGGYNWGEGVFFCIENFTPKCYNLSFNVRSCNPPFYDTKLRVVAVHPDALTEGTFPPNGGCFATLPVINPTDYVKLMQLEVMSPYYWSKVSLDFSVDPSLIKHGVINLWFYGSNFACIDDIVLSDGACNSFLEINDNNYTSYIGSEFRADDYIEILSSNKVDILPNTQYLAGNRIDILPHNTQFSIPQGGDGSILFDIASCKCNDGFTLTPLSELGGSSNSPLIKLDNKGEETSELFNEDGVDVSKIIQSYTIYSYTGVLLKKVENNLVYKMQSVAEIKSYLTNQSYGVYIVHLKTLDGDIEVLKMFGGD